MSTGIIDIDNTPDVAIWNKKIHIKNDTVVIVYFDHLQLVK
jgi:hypothetical protein